MLSYADSRAVRAASICALVILGSILFNTESLQVEEGTEMATRLDSSAKGAATPKKPVTPKPPVSSGGGGPFRAISIPKGAISAPAPAPRLAPRAPATGSSGTSQNLGSSSTGVVGAMTSEPLSPPPPPAMTDEEFLAQDSEFIDTNASLDSELANLKAQLTRQRGDYELDINNSKRNMGSLEGGGWNTKDKLTSYGNAFNNQQNDFASRGMLDSSLYGGALDDLNRGFNTQRSDLDAALGQFLGGQSEQLTQADDAKKNAVLSARRQALSRLASNLSLGG